MLEFFYLIIYFHFLEKLRHANEKQSELSTTLNNLCLNTKDVMVEMFDGAETVQFWLKSGNPRAWSGAPWAEYSITDKNLMETKAGGVQDTWNNKFIANYSPKRWTFTDTHINFFQRTTQDCLMHLPKRPLSMVSIGLVIELVGQNETGFPSNDHKAKFIRDLMRIHKRRGYLGRLCGALTDLSRIICFQLEGPENGMRFQRTAEEGGALVRKRMVAFLCANPNELGKQLQFFE